MSAVSSTDLASQQHPDQVRSDIAVDGMTCAACSNRIQRKLTRLDGVTDAQVNFATGRATVVRDSAVLDQQLFDVIESLVIRLSRKTKPMRPRIVARPICFGVSWWASF